LPDAQVGTPLKASIGSKAANRANRPRSKGGSSTLVASPEGAFHDRYCSTAFRTTKPGSSTLPAISSAGQDGRGVLATAHASLHNAGRHAPAPTRNLSAAYNRGQSTLSARTLASTQEISTFLAAVERRAFKQAMFAVRDEDAALDIVQDAMLKLTEKYAAKPAGELPLLFQRILQNTIHDHFRRAKVRSTWTILLSALGGKDDKDEEYDPLETMPSRSDSSIAADPASQLEQGQVVAAIEQALARLPARQREAFLLRYWEEFDVAETAAAMGCSEGSVKTHCSRAVRALAETLSARGIKL
jgi:RNA polymerase sigma-70 factor (ECF subfamily)